MKALMAFALLIPFAASAEDLNCSIKAAKTTTKAKMTAMAKVSDAAARKTALGAVPVSGATVSKGGLEVEDGCLIYSYDIKVPGKSGVEEVLVDAGTGKVLKMEHEGSVKETAEKAMDKMKK